MSIKQQWIEYCDGEPQYATEDEWNQFVNLIYTDWRNQQIIDDPNCSIERAWEDHDYIQERYSFVLFTRTAQEFCEIENLNSCKFATPSDPTITAESE